MPKGRMLSKSITHNDKIAKLSLPATLLFTWCIPQLDCDGKMLGDIWSLKAIVPHVDEIQPKDIQKIIQEWIDADLVFYYGNQQKYLKFKGFTAHQKINKEREAESVIPEPNSTNSGVTQELLKMNSDHKVKVKVKVKDNIYIVHFEKLWSAYPKKLGRKSALKHFIATVQNEAECIAIEKALNVYMKHLADNNTETQYIQLGSTWFNNWKDWVDYVEPPPKDKDGKEWISQGVYIKNGVKHYTGKEG